MLSNNFKPSLIKAGLAASVLLLSSGTSFAQTTPQQINLTAAPTTLTMPDGSAVPMWGYFCNTTQVSGSLAGCAALNTKAAAGTWSPVLITVPYTTGTVNGVPNSSTTTLTINLTNNLVFTAPGTTTVTASLPTSLTIIGQLGGGLGTVGTSCLDTATGIQHGGTTCTLSPTHTGLPTNNVTWSTPGTTAAFTPPPQGPRVQSFATEVPAPNVAGTTGTPAALCFGNCTATMPGLTPGTYLIESGTHPSIQGPMGLYGILVVTTAPTPTAAGTAYPAVTTPAINGTAAVTTPAVTYNAEVPIVLGEIDPVQNTTVGQAVTTIGFSETTVWSGQPGGCGNPVTSAGQPNSAFNTCYPPTANYTPLYYTINGVAFDRTHAANSLFPVTQGSVTGTIATTGTVLVRLVNAGSRMHVPSIVGAQTTQLTLTPGGTGTATTATVPGFSIVAEDGNRSPGVPHVQSDVFMAAGKTFDVLVNVPAPPSGGTVTPALPVYDRELSLSGDAIERDAGMLAYIGVNNAQPPATVATTTAAVARADSYPSLMPCTAAPCAPVVVSDPGKGVIANDTNVYGVTLLGAPTGGTVVLNPNGTFTFTPTPGLTTPASFAYCGNTSAAAIAATGCPAGLSATVTLSGATTDAGGLTLAANTFTSTTASYLQVRNPGLLTGAVDSAGYPLTLASVVPITGVTLLTDPSGGFSATVASGTKGNTTCPQPQSGAQPYPAGTQCFAVNYTAQSAYGTQLASTSTTAATLIFLPASGVKVTVLDGYDHTTTISDYRWVIEEDETFFVDPNRTNTCPLGSTTCTAIVPTFGTNFHTSYMRFVAQGCTGAVSCEGGQTMIDLTPGSATFGQHIPAVCDVGNGQCRPDPNPTNATLQGTARLDPSQVYLDPTKRYYISVLPGDAANPFEAGNTSASCNQNGVAKSSNCGHGMGGAPIPAVSCPANATVCSFAAVGATAIATCTPAPCTPARAVTALTQPSPYPPAKLSVFVFEDDFPLNGEHDAGGAATTPTGNDTVAPLEPGLGGFQLHLWDAMGGNGDFTGQMTYDMFNMPLTNSLDGMIDPSTGQNACPITQIGISNPGTNATSGPIGTDGTAATTAGISGMIVTCPTFEADGQTLSPLAGQAVIANLMPGRWGVIATPGADRIARGEEWLQTNTLDGQKAHDSFTRVGEPSYFQEFGPASFHVSIGFANPAIINARLKGVCAGTDVNVTGNCSPGNTLIGRVVGERLSRTPDERLYGSGSHDAFAWTQCYVSVGDPDGEDFAFAKCDANGNFKLTGLPNGDWRITTFDQWNDALVDGLSTPVRLGSTQACPGAGSQAPNVCDMGDIATTQWQTNLQTKTFIDDNQDGIAQSTETGIPFANVAVRLRDGSLENLQATDFTGTANFNETFPLFSWYTVETDVTRYKNTGTHAVYDAGGPADNSQAWCGSAAKAATAGYPTCGTSTIASNLANTSEQVSLPNNLRIPGSVYCTNADCTGFSINPAATGTTNTPSTCTYTAGIFTGLSPTPPSVSCTPVLSTGRIDNPWYGGVEGWQGFPGQFSFLEFGKAPYVAGENGGIKGHVVYASTRPFDDPQLLVQTQWEPLVPHVRINLYQESSAADGVTPTLKLVDWTTTSSFDDWAQGFNTLNVAGNAGIPNMSCPGQTGSDLFYFTLWNQPEYLDYYNNVQHGTATAPTPLPYNSQFKCYDGMHNWNQLQPAPYDGMYKFPSVTVVDQNGKPLPGKAGTNCTVCVADPAPTTDLYAGVPMLPPGKYVVEIVMPPGFELVKEEDKNILIGDNFIAPALQEFAGASAVFIVPDQASVAASQQYAGPSYNANNPQNSTTNLGASPQNGIVPAFVPEPLWPCVGEKRVVPDYISLYPQSHQASPFAGATRALCDRKEVTLNDQTGAIAKFYVYTSTHTASKFTGGITDDYTSEFDPFSPQFGEKFAPPDLPVSVKDWTGQEISRVYADQWGAYNGMTYSTWEVNPPNPTGYSPTMMVLCMNDPGPVLDTRQTIVNASGATVANPTLGQQVTDPAFTDGYSQFCYELPFMPETTQYLDTPVVPTSAFAGAGYNNPDCAYPTLTPAIREVDSQDGVGPWVSATGHTITIYAQGDIAVPNNAYNGPSATTAPYNQKTVMRHYGFGNTRGTAALVSLPNNGVPGTATVNLNITSWVDGKIVASVPTAIANNSHFACPIQQQAQYNGGTVTSARCGQLVITTANTAGAGQPSNAMQSVDAVTVTVGGKTPTHVGASASIQAAIDAAEPGDMLMIDPGTHNEMLIMWKPLRLQGVGAASSIINANTHPAGKMDAWRREVTCLFGLTITGYVRDSNHPVYDTSGQYDCKAGSVFGSTLNGWSNLPPVPQSPDGSIDPQVDRLAMEAILGWDASQNGNLAELLQEPALMGALEGAGITVLAKGVKLPVGASNIVGAGDATAGAFPVGTVLLNKADCTTHPEPSNFLCNPSSIDGLGITNSSQGGGGIFVHAYGHYLVIANNKIYNNAGTLSGGINLGQGEFPPQNTIGGILVEPGSCDRNSMGNNATIPVTLSTNQQEPYCANLYVNIQHNAVIRNSSTGDELFSATPAGAGGVSICSGADYYKLNYNWICGNLSSGDGGGVGHLGYSWNGDIEHNTIIFNQSLNPTIPANGGGMIVMGAPDADPTCSTTNDQDCVSPANSIGPSDGVGPNLVINANLIQGNAAEAGSGGGIAFQNVNGSDVIAFPTTPANWHHVTVTNNIIVDNVAGWDGGGVSFLDALNLDFVNNTVANNNSTATAGVLVNTLGAPLASTQNTTNNCYGTTGGCGTVSLPQPAGIVVIPNSAVLAANMAPPITAAVTCPPNHYAPNTSATNGTCMGWSYPVLANNIFYDNASFQIGVGALTPVNPVYQQNVVTLYNAQYSGSGTTHGTTVATQGTTGQCVSGSNYWDIGVRGDTGPASNAGGITLNPTYSDLSSGVSRYASSNFSSLPGFTRQYCDGARQPPESGASGWNVPPGISDATVPNPIFNLTPVATVDEGNNWINLRWGPLSLVAPVANGTLGAGGLLSNYAPVTGSNNIPASTISPYPTTALDFYGHPRPDAGTNIDAGAVEVNAGVVAVTPFAIPLPAIRLPVQSPAAQGNAQVNALGNGNAQ